MQFFHLSHTDLDGYGCQMVSREYFKEQIKQNGGSMHFFNANYGKEVLVRMEQILRLIKNNAQRFNETKHIESTKSTKSKNSSFNSFGSFGSSFGGFGGSIRIREDKKKDINQNTQNRFNEKKDSIESKTKSDEIRFNEKKDSIKKVYILISDLNLTLAECASFVEQINDLKSDGFEIEFEVLDHHKSGAECAEKYPWYFLDENRCATKIVYDKFCERGWLPSGAAAQMAHYVKMINSIDLWLENEPDFEFGKVALRLIVESRELTRSMFDRQDRDYKLSLMQTSAKFLEQEHGNIALDNAFLEMKKNYLGGSLNSDTLDNIASAFVCDLLCKMGEKCEVFWGKYRGFMTFSIGNISVLANLFLKKNPQYDFFMDVGPRGSVSLRANNKCDVSALSAECFKGGGHANASGGKIDNFAESFIYENIKNQIQSIFDSSPSGSKASFSALGFNSFSKTEADEDWNGL